MDHRGARGGNGVGVPDSDGPKLPGNREIYREILQSHPRLRQNFPISSIYYVITARRWAGSFATPNREFFHGGAVPFAISREFCEGIPCRCGTTPRRVIIGAPLKPIYP
jgi:hypothetical protein